MKKLRFPRLLVLTLTPVVLGFSACGSTDRGAEIANSVAYAASALAVTHGVLDSEVNNPVTGLTVILYDCLAREANQFVGAPEPPFEVPPVVRVVIAGPATGRSRQTYELTSQSSPLTEAPAGRVISLVGSQFSAVKEQNLVKIDGQPVQFSALSSGTLLTTAVPFIHHSFPAQVEVQVLVRGVPSRPVKLTIIRPPRVPEAPSILAKRLLQKQYLLASRIQAVPWEELAATGKPTSRMQRLTAADKINQCARDLSVQLNAFDTKLNEDARFLEVHEIVLHVSPEVETLVDEALEKLPKARQSAPQG